MNQDAAGTRTGVSPPQEEGLRITPMMAQYLEIKRDHPDCLLFYRMGDFYELFFGDAAVAAKALGIVLTKRGKHAGEDIAMCGVPVERSDDYLHRLIALGHRVAVCEQIEDPAEAKKRGGKSPVRRAVVRLVTPGTITEERLLDPARANVLAALVALPALGGGAASSEDTVYGLAFLDISTGAFQVRETPRAGLAAALARAEPREIVVSDRALEDAGLRSILEGTRAALTPVARESADGVSAERRLTGFFGVATLAGFGNFTRAEVAAAAAAISYLERTQFDARPNLMPPCRDAVGATLEIDAATRASLELTRTLSGERTGSLAAAIDRCVTPAGTRLLAERLAGPLTDPIAIGARHDAVAFLIEDGVLRADLRRVLAGAPDMARALSRLSLGRGGPRDLAALRDGLFAVANAAALIARDGVPSELAGAALECEVSHASGALARDIADALADAPPASRRDGGFVRPGHTPALDEARALRDESRRVVAGLQSRYAELAQTKQLKIRHNNFLGFFIEVPQAQGEKLTRPPFNADFIHRQTMTDAMRFSTPELANLEARMASAADRALALELAVFDRLTDAAVTARSGIAAAAHKLSIFDVTAGLAELAAAAKWVRPQIDASLAFMISGGRHPVVEAALASGGAGFVSNDCDLSSDAGAAAGRIAVVTGPNMAGKSTFLRQNALMVVLAQMGAFVPAAAAHIGVVDRLFSRVGAADDLARGRSTFMVEMVETAAILNQATSRSLVILDEIGRGTATFDGLSIAWAAIEHLHDVNRSRALFATHFHELTFLTKKLRRLVTLTMRVTDWNGEVVFLHEVVPGAADRSYGIQVARLAGLPLKVVERAKRLLAELEAGNRRSPVQKLIDDLPLFGAWQPPPPPPTPPKNVLRDAIDLLHPDEMTPKQALAALYEIKKLA